MMSDQVLNVLLVIQIVVSVLLVISILLQNRSEGLGSIFGGSAGGEAFRTRRGLEKLLYNLTIAFAVIFVVLSFMIVKFTGTK
ncbi:MAG: hypothetical protein Fur003_2550 [Candidatus Dojkabacteria bacterium]